MQPLGRGTLRHRRAEKPLREPIEARLAERSYSLFESAKIYGVEPRAYLREATLRAVRNPGTVTLARELKASES